MDIAKIDKNFKSTALKEYGDIDWYDIHTAPIALYGFYDEEKFYRMDSAVAEQTNEGVAQLYKHTAGGRARFSTNSPFIALFAELDGLCIFPNMALIGSSGFDLYDENENLFVGAYRPLQPKTTIAEALQIPSLSAETRAYTLNFPLYNGVRSVYIGLKKGSSLLPGKAYQKGKKIVYYGSSITQGGCASRPGMCYQHILARRNNIDHLNLGFSGSARGEEVMARYIAELPMCLFVYDYDHNAPTPEHLKNTHERFFQIFRKKQPETPVLMISSPPQVAFTNNARRRIIESTYLHAKENGDANVYFLDGASLFEGPNDSDCTVDGTHPTDLGFLRMADKIEGYIHKIL